MFGVAVVELDELMVRGKVLHLSDYFDVLKHGGGDYVVQVQVFGEKSHAVLKEAAVYEFAVNPFQEDKFEVLVLRIFHQYSLQHLYGT